ncbi:MAG: cysteine desulfurase family protein [Lachnospiraceae bacterium]|nr:cysteine desulfurase family protein [Lachnospiraceae bacterium]
MIYLDNAATTPVHPEVLKAMLPYLDKQYGNPSGIYEFAEKSKEAIDGVREVIARSINAKPEEIYFTSGGTESDNWALTGMAEALKDKGKHIITTSVEHHAVINTCEYLRQRGFDITYLDVDGEGIINPSQLIKAIRKDTILISIMAANNETGSIQPVQLIGEIARRNNICFHTDAVQAYLHMDIDVNKMNIGMMSASAHKFRGAKGCGFLYIRNGIKPAVFMHGGKQESGIRAGTENVPGIIGMGKAVQIAMQDMDKNIVYVRNMRDYLLYRIEHEIPGVILNGPRHVRLPGNLNISFLGVEGQSLLIMLDMDGICTSSGSACTAGLGGGSHVLKALGADGDRLKGALRMTLDSYNTMEEMDYVVWRLKENVAALRGRN